MEYLGVFGFVFALLVWHKVSALSERVRKLEGFLKEEGYVDAEKASLREILGKNIGKFVKLELASEAADYAVEKKECMLLDADEDWIKVRMKQKKQEEYLLRIDFIESVQFIES